MNLIVRGRDFHTVRLEQSLASLGQPFKTVTDPSEIKNIRYSIAFVDPSFGYDISTILKADKIVFYDCEDSPTDFYPGEAYYTLKCDRYVKMNYIDNDRKDDIKNVAFPLPVYMHLATLANIFKDIREVNTSYRPTFIGHPTYIGRYDHPDLVKHKNSVGCKVLSSTGMYNQRIDWVKSIRELDSENKDVGIVFSKADNNLNIKFHLEHFGDVRPYEVPAIAHNQLCLKNAVNKMSLCPTGHERLSWRIWDIMSSGSILFITDFGQQKSFYMPKEYVIVEDKYNIAEVISKLSNQDLLDLHKAAKKNQDFILSLTPEKIWEDFIRSL